ncbi:MAG: glycosyltransferase family 2 protein [Candidatus Portnoybacteria bacterium]
MLSIIITHYQSPTLLKLCLESIKKNIGDLEYELIVLDSQAEEDTRDLIKEYFPQARYIPFLKNITNYAKLVNIGLKKAKGEYILILNHDIIILNDAIIKLLNYIKENSQVGIVGPRLLTFSNQAQESCFRFPNIGAVIARRTLLRKFNWGKERLSDFLIKDKDFSSPQPVDWMQGSAMLVRKEAIKKVGLWDERFVRYFEDTDWCRRFWQNNYQVVLLPQAQVSHYYGRHSKKWGPFLDPFLNKYTRMHLISAFKYFLKWRGKKNYA